MDAPRASRSSSLAGRTPSSPRWRPAAAPGPRCWTRSASAPRRRHRRHRLPAPRRHQPAAVRRTLAVRRPRRPQRHGRRLRRHPPGVPAGRPARGGPGPHPLRPSPLPAPTTAAARHQRSAAQTRGEFALANPTTWPEPQTMTSTATLHDGTATATAWDRLHPRLTHRAAWLDHQGELPVINGTLIRLQVERLPGDRDPKPVWLWSSRTNASADDSNRLWRAFLRRFDLEHTVRLFKQTLGWTAPKIRTPAAADRWT